jgi:hypothetical protein
MTTTTIVLLALLAQAAPAAPLQDKAKAKALLGEGSSLYEKGDYTGALEKFHAAYAAYSSPKIWFNIGQANRDLGRPVDALEAFQKFLDGVPDAAPEDKADAQASVVELQKRLGRLTIVCETTGAEISVDGKPVGVAPLAKPIWVVPGPHQVLASKQGAPLALGSAEATAGGVATVVLRGAQPAAAAPPPVAPAAATEATPPPPIETAAPPPPPAPAVDVSTSPERAAEPGEGWFLGRKWTWVAGGAAVLFTGTAAVIGGLAQSRFKDLKKSCGVDSDEGLGCDKGSIDSLQTRMTTANVFWGLAGAAAVTAGVLFFVEGRPVVVAPMAGESKGLVARMEF